MPSKILIVGARKSGKTTLMNAVCKSPTNKKPFVSFEAQGKEFRFMDYDQPDYVLEDYLTYQAQATLLVFDPFNSLISYDEQIKHLQKMKALISKNSSNSKFVLVVTKCDEETAERQIKDSLINKLQEELKLSSTQRIYCSSENDETLELIREHIKNIVAQDDLKRTPSFSSSTLTFTKSIGTPKDLQSNELEIKRPPSNGVSIQITEEKLPDTIIKVNNLIETLTRQRDVSCWPSTRTAMSQELDFWREVKRHCGLDPSKTLLTCYEEVRNNDYGHNMDVITGKSNCFTTTASSKFIAQLMKPVTETTALLTKSSV